MNIESAKILAGSSAKLGGGMGISTMVMAYFQVNAAGIGALCTLITLACYIFFQRLSLKKERLSAVNKKDLADHIIAFNEHKKETNIQFKYVNKSLDKIINKLTSQ